MIPHTGFDADMVTDPLSLIKDGLQNLSQRIKIPKHAGSFVFCIHCSGRTAGVEVYFTESKIIKLPCDYVEGIGMVHKELRDRWVTICQLFEIFLLDSP